jgi:hypothetical protein
MIIQWIRKLLGITPEQQLSSFEIEHFAKFEKALAESDVRVYVYDRYTKGERLILCGDEFHCVTTKNLVSFHKLNRQSRRLLHKVLDDGTSYDMNKTWL